MEQTLLSLTWLWYHFPDKLYTLIAKMEIPVFSVKSTSYRMLFLSFRLLRIRVYNSLMVTIFFFLSSYQIDLNRLVLPFYRIPLDIFSSSCFFFHSFLLLFREKLEIMQSPKDNIPNERMTLIRSWWRTRNAIEAEQSRAEK